jgi:KDO2-lipid IV(A) lauroyltransferase
MAMPELTPERTDEIMLGVWDNLGRTVAEYPYLSRSIMAQRMKVLGSEVFDEVRASGKSALFVGGHFANWELAPKTAGLHNLPLVLIYRPANNTLVDGIIRKTRLTFAQSMFAKGRKGAQELIKAIKEHKPIGMLVDQKLNDGIAVPFFGHDAMTAPAVAELALKYDLPIYMAQVVREKGAHFTVTMHPHLQFEKTGDRKQDVYSMMRRINDTFEDWARQHPEQWFWVHRRWPKPQDKIKQ